MLSNFRQENESHLVYIRLLSVYAFQFKISSQNLGLLLGCFFTKHYPTRLKRYCIWGKCTILTFIKINSFITQAKQYILIWKKYHHDLRKHFSNIFWLNLTICDICMYRLLASVQKLWRNTSGKGKCFPIYCDKLEK